MKVVVYGQHKTATSSLLKSFQRIKCDTFAMHHDASIKSYFQKINSLYETIHIVLCYRDPFTRHISSFFQWFSIKDPKMIVDVFENVSDNFVNTFPGFHSNANFDNYVTTINELLNIDLLSIPFDKEKGYSIIKSGKYTLHLLRFDKMKEFETLLQPSFSQFKMSSANVTEDKKYNNEYKSFKERFLYPKQLCQFILDKNLIYMKYFYSEQELAGIFQQFVVEEDNLATGELKEITA